MSEVKAKIILLFSVVMMGEFTEHKHFMRSCVVLFWFGFLTITINGWGFVTACSLVPSLSIY